MNDTFSPEDYERSLYLDWLFCKCGAIGKDVDRDVSYFKLFSRLESIPFTWCIENDDNRASDGIELRRDFMAETGVNLSFMMIEECTFLELLYGIAQRIDLILYDKTYGDRSKEWFWMLLRNLNLDYLDDDCYDNCTDSIVLSKCEDVNLRRYDFNGKGGLFPCKNVEEDQRFCEIWWQMNAFLFENFEF